MFLASLYYSQTGWPVFYGNCYGSCFCRNSDLLPIEYRAFSMLSLSNQYAATTTDTPRTMLLASGQALLTGLQSSTFYVSYILMSTAGLIISSVMLRSNNIFSKVTAYVGILASVLGLGLFVPSAHFSQYC